MNDETKSKTQLKNEVNALQQLGEQLVDMSSDQIEKMDLPAGLFSAVQQARQIRQHGAKRRQLQYIGKLMRDIDPEPILKSLRNIRQGDSDAARSIKKIEGWRDEIKKGNIKIIEEIIDCCPNAQRQRLSQLSRNVCNPKKIADASRASRALFRYLKEIYMSKTVL